MPRAVSEPLRSPPASLPPAAAQVRERHLRALYINVPIEPAAMQGDAAAAGDSSVKFQVGANGGQTIAVDFGDISASGNAAFTALSAGAGTGGFISAQTTASAITTASTAVVAIDSAITSVNSQRATFGAAINQLTYAIDNLSSVKVNAEASRSRILDTDYASQTSELARTQIIQQAGTAMLAQANQLPQTVLSLLQ